MSIIQAIIGWIISIILILICYRSFGEKIRNLFSFYKTISEYEFMADGITTKLIVSFLVMSDLLIAIILLIPSYRVIASSIGIIVQLFYFLSMILNYNKSFVNNCECFSFNAPKQIDFRAIAINLVLIFLYISLLLLLLNK